MKNNFDFNKYLKNNPLLKESRWEEKHGLFFGYDTQPQGVKAPDSVDKKLDRERNAMARNPMVKGLAQALAKLKSRPFTANQLTRILKGTSPKFFEAAADQAGFVYDILQSDSDGNADYEVMDQKYTDKGAAISYIDGKFNRIG